MEAKELLVQDTEVPFFDQAPVVDLTVAAAIDSYGVVMFIEHDGIGLDGSASVWVYRHEPGMGEPPGDPPDTTGGDDGGSDEGGSDDDGGDATGTGEVTSGAGGDSNGADDGGGLERRRRCWWFNLGRHR